MVALRHRPEDVPDELPGHALRRRNRSGGDPTASDPTPGALIRTQHRPAPAGPAPEEDHMRNRAW
jgi:hypothetical protein